MAFKILIFHIPFQFFVIYLTYHLSHLPPESHSTLLPESHTHSAPCPESHTFIMLCVHSLSWWYYYIQYILHIAFHQECE